MLNNNNFVDNKVIYLTCSCYKQKEAKKGKAKKCEHAH